MEYYKPFPGAFFQQIAEKIFSPIVQGESVYVRWFPGHGKTLRLHQLLSDKKLLRAGLGAYWDRFLIIRLSTDFGAARPTEFFDMVKEAVTDSLTEQQLITPSKRSHPSKNVPPLTVTLKRIIELCRTAIATGREIVFLIDVNVKIPDETRHEFFGAWEQIVESQRERIHTHINHPRIDLAEAGILPAALIQQVVTVPLPTKSECDYYLNFFIKEWGIKITATQIQAVWGACGHDLWLIKESLRILKRNPDTTDLLGEPTLLLKAKLEFGEYDERERATISAKVKTDSVPGHLRPTAQELVKMRFWDHNYTVPKIFAQVILQSEAVHELTYDATRKSLRLGTLDLRHALTGTEHEVLKLLFQRKGATTEEGKVVSRDEVGEVIWGKDLLEKYSDWAIDKAVSRLRAKLGHLTPAYRIVTKKKAGFYLQL